MATSGVRSFNVSRNDVIYLALEDIRAYSPDFEDPVPAALTRANKRLNMMIKAWQAAGVGLWLNDFIQVPLQGGTPKYTLNNGPSSRYMIYQTLAVSAASGAATITLTDASSISATDIIGIETDSNYTHWTTVNGAPVGNVVTLTAVLTAAAAAGNSVFSYLASEVLVKPIDVNGVYLWTPDGSEVTMMGTITLPGGTMQALTPMSRPEYLSLPNTYSSGPPTMYYFDRQLADADLYVWPVHTDMSCVLIVDCRIPVQDFVNIDDNPDFPVEWADALHYNLALRLAPAYDVPDRIYSKVKEMAVVTLQDADGFDREQNVSVSFTPDFGE
jgi:hypothetical protein